MLRAERLEILLAYLEKNNFATVKKIAKEIFMSETTVRRDLKYLEELNVVKRSYGCATLIKNLNKTIPFDFRRNEFRQEKNKIAFLATEQVNTGETIFLDESSTSCSMVQYLKPELDITVVTNSLILTSLLYEKNIKCYCTGGLLYHTTFSFLGKFSENLINNMFADKFFFSTAGLSFDGIISDKMEETVSINKLMAARSDKKIFLCDHSKFGKKYTFELTNLNNTDLVITDKKPPEEFLEINKNFIY